MLQIIGWLGCLYLIVKGLEIAGNASSYKPQVVDPEKMELRSPASVAIVLAFAGAIGLAWWLGAQGGAFEPGAEYSGGSDLETYADCLAQADTNEETMACVQATSQ